MYNSTNNSTFTSKNISKHDLLELLLQIRKDSKELVEIGKQFWEYIKNNNYDTMERM